MTDKSLFLKLLLVRIVKIRIVDHFQLDFITLLLVIRNDNILTAGAGATPTCPSRRQVSSCETAASAAFEFHLICINA